ncbi:putative integral membrane protein (apicoplast) [Babesia bovis T2Bo]|uniref:Uncharacterized protein n=1 Tax=Babesia bovis TaxID=5865 RepID=A7AXF1_BABBO|nr:putative integral membrane protein [Babesia bovis T2Bo]EDO05074.1 putative integral membrane protein [Babesia bovis T2Bo]|eukprot:YP_002290854.1 hypothetical protein BBOV_V000190 (apicoplast) [Babesia bovis T2Bo]
MTEKLNLFLNIIKHSALYIEEKLEYVLYISAIILLYIVNYIRSLLVKKSLKEKICDFFYHNRAPIFQYIVFIILEFSSCPLSYVIQFYIFAFTLHKSQFENFLNIVPYIFDKLYTLLFFK